MEWLIYHQRAVVAAATTRQVCFQVVSFWGTTISGFNRRAARAVVNQKKGSGAIKKIY